MQIILIIKYGGNIVNLLLIILYIRDIKYIGQIMQIIIIMGHNKITKGARLSVELLDDK